MLSQAFPTPPEQKQTKQKKKKQAKNKDALETSQAKNKDRKRLNAWNTKNYFDTDTMNMC